MSVAHTLPPQSVTAADYDRFLDAYRGTERFELIDGDIALMAPATVTHATIVTNIGSALHNARGRHGCRVYMGDLGSQRTSAADELYRPTPDVIVRCADAALQAPLPPSTRYLTDATVVVEVHSPTTIDRDRGIKLDFYKSLTTLKHIVHIYQDDVRVELYTRTQPTDPAQQDDPDFIWGVPLVSTQLGDTLALTALQFEMTLAAIYEDTVLASDAAT